MSARRQCAGIAASALTALAVLAPAGGASTGGRERHAGVQFAPAVQAMVVGRGGAILYSSPSVAASEASVQLGSRSCTVAAATPLAVLLAIHRAGGPGFALRDYGHCGSAPTSSSQLFVYTLGGEANSGQDGWEYKVGGAAGSTGAADPSGPSGDGRRIGGGERVLWFWCQASGGGCERTLEVSAASPARRGHALTTTVYGYDNEGRGVPVAGALVSLGGARAVTGAHGHATLLAPPRGGRYRLSATRAGMVASFPVAIAVR
jgi:hypothetical protein